MAMVQPTELEALMGSATVVDVRSPTEYEAAHLPGGFNLPLDWRPECAQDFGSATSGSVVLVCRSGQRAEAAQRDLRGAARCDLRVLPGGLGAWEAAGLPVNRGRRRRSMERQVRGAAGALVLAGLLASLKVRPTGLVSMAVGAGLLFSAVRDTCAMAKVLGKPPSNQGADGDGDALLREMSARRQAMTAVAD